MPVQGRGAQLVGPFSMARSNRLLANKESPGSVTRGCPFQPPEEIFGRGKRSQREAGVHFASPRAGGSSALGGRLWLSSHGMSTRVLEFASISGIAPRTSGNQVFGVEIVDHNDLAHGLFHSLESSDFVR